MEWLLGAVTLSAVVDSPWFYFFAFIASVMMVMVFDRL